MVNWGPVINETGKLLLERHNPSNHCRINNPNSIGSVADRTHFSFLQRI